MLTTTNQTYMTDEGRQWGTKQKETEMKRIITAAMIGIMMATTAYAGAYPEVGMRIVPKKGAVMEVIKVKHDKRGRLEKEKICVREVGKAGECKWEGADAREGVWEFP